MSLDFPQVLTRPGASVEATDVPLKVGQRSLGQEPMVDMDLPMSRLVSKDGVVEAWRLSYERTSRFIEGYCLRTGIKFSENGLALWFGNVVPQYIEVQDILQNALTGTGGLETASNAGLIAVHQPARHAL